MTQLTIFPEDNPDEVQLDTIDRHEIAQTLKQIGIFYEVWPIDKTITSHSNHEQILTAYSAFIQKLIHESGYQTYDVIALNADHPNKAALREKFLSEHTHSEDEVRFFVSGKGLFTVHKAGFVYSLLCMQGDLINVPAYTKHWFDMGEKPNFVVIRFFNNPEGWVAQYTGSHIAQNFPRLSEVTTIIA